MICIFIFDGVTVKTGEQILLINWAMPHYLTGVVVVGGGGGYSRGVINRGAAIVRGNSVSYIHTLL